MPDEDELLARARSGDEGALTELVRHHEGVVFRFLLARTRDEDAAADLSQETFLKAFRSLDSFRGDSTFRTWLLAIAKNEVRGRHRTEMRRGEQELDETVQLVDPTEGPEDRAVRATEVARVREALERLPEKQRLSVSLRLFDGLSFREVADATESTEGAARVNYFHGVRRLREWLDE